MLHVQHVHIVPATPASSPAKTCELSAAPGLDLPAASIVWLAMSTRAQAQHSCSPYLSAPGAVAQLPHTHARRSVLRAPLCLSAG